MLTICILSLAVILFAVLWGKGIIKPTGDNDKIPWREIVGPEISQERWDKVPAHKDAEVEDMREKFEWESFMRAEAAWVEEESSHLDSTKYLMFVDDRHPITQEYIDENFPLVDVVNRRGRTIQLERMTRYYFYRLQEYLEREEGIIVDLDYGYRSLADQQALIDKMTEEHGAEYARYYAADPGTSEHHTGLAVDLCLIVDGAVIDENEAMNAETEIFGRIHSVIEEFGFILDFPYESWHLRFVGSPDIARAYNASGMSFEAFCTVYVSNN